MYGCDAYANLYWIWISLSEQIHDFHIYLGRISKSN